MAFHREQGWMLKLEAGRESVQCRQIVDSGYLQGIPSTAFDTGHLRIGLLQQFGYRARSLGARDGADKEGQGKGISASLLMERVLNPLENEIGDVRGDVRQ